MRGNLNLSRCLSITQLGVVRPKFDACVTRVCPLCYHDRAVNPQDILTMPKLKTHKGASKRFKKTGTGKIKRHHAFARHILTSKSRSRKRKLGQGVIASDANSPEIHRMLPY